MFCLQFLDANKGLDINSFFRCKANSHITTCISNLCMQSHSMGVFLSLLNLVCEGSEDKDRQANMDVSKLNTNSSGA